MASLLVAARDFFQHPDPIKRARASCKKGYVVDIRDTNQERGSQEGLPDFVYIHVSDSKAQAQRFKDHEDENKKYSHKIPPGLVDQAISANGELTINPNQVVIT